MLFACVHIVKHEHTTHKHAVLTCANVASDFSAPYQAKNTRLLCRFRLLDHNWAILVNMDSVQSISDVISKWLFYPPPVGSLQSFDDGK